MNHRIEKLSTLLVANESHQNVENINEIPIELENGINETNDDNSCSSTIKVNPVLITKSKRFKSNSSKTNIGQTCNTKISISTQLSIHNRLHLQQKPFACDQCQKSFTNISYLTIHIRVHTGDKPYHCEICKKKFSNSSDLRRHQRIHTGEKPYSCDLCLKKFSQSSNLLTLKRLHHYH